MESVLDGGDETERIETSVGSGLGRGENDLAHRVVHSAFGVEEAELRELPLAAVEELVVLVAALHDEVIEQDGPVLHVLLHLLELGHDFLDEEARGA